jgi:hypothetical protein
MLGVIAVGVAPLFATHKLRVMDIPSAPARGRVIGGIMVFRPCTASGFGSVVRRLSFTLTECAEPQSFTGNARTVYEGTVEVAGAAGLPLRRARRLGAHRERLGGDRTTGNGDW